MWHTIAEIIFFFLLFSPLLFCVMFINETINSDRRISHAMNEDRRKRKIQEIESEILRSFLLNRGNVYLTAHSFSFGTEADKDYVIQITKKYGVWDYYFDNLGRRISR